MGKTVNSGDVHNDGKTFADRLCWSRRSARRSGAGMTDHLGHSAARGLVLRAVAQEIVSEHDWQLVEPTELATSFTGGW